MPTPSSKGSTLDMSSEDPVAVRAMLQYLYTGTLEVPFDKILVLDGPDIPSISTLREVYRLATKYELEDLQISAVEEYCGALATPWPKGHGMLLAKALVDVFAEDLPDTKVFQDATIEAAMCNCEQLFTDTVIFDMLQGGPMRALALALCQKINESRSKDVGGQECDVNVSSKSLATATKED